MPHDGGLIATLEQYIVDTLAVLQNEGVAVFKTAEKWRHQIAATAGGLDAMDRYEPFAFVSYMDADNAREGSRDLREVLSFAVLIGVCSREDGICRYGDANNLGTSKIRDLVIAAFDKQRPDDPDVKCDEFYYIRDFEIVDSPKRHAIQMVFEVSQMNTSN